MKGGFEEMIFWLLLKLEIKLWSYNILNDFGFF
jgi:hypothetical protein